MAYHFSFASKFNTERLFDIDTSNFEYRNLEEVYESDDEVFPVRGIYINTKGKFGDRPVIATDECYVNLPAHLLDTAREILNDTRAVQAINAGEVGFTIYAYEQRRFGKTCYSIRWVDMPSDDDMGG